MKTICPGCERRTFWASRRHQGGTRYRQRKPDGYLAAVTADGSCTTCWRDRNGVTRSAEGLAIHPGTFRTPMTDTEMEIARRSLARMVEDRRRRGVPADGVDPGWVRRRGLTLLEV